MSSKLTVKRVIKTREPYHGVYQGKPYTIYEADVDCVIDGEEHKALVKTGKKDVLDGLAEGQTFFAERQDRRGFISWKLGSRVEAGQQMNLPSGSAPSGGFKPRNEKSIVAQSSLKAAVELVVADKVQYQDDAEYVGRVTKLAGELMAWVEGQGQ